MHFDVIAPARVEMPGFGAVGVVRTPPGQVTHHKQISVRPARGERIVLTGPVLFLRLITRQRDEQDHGAPAPQYTPGEADLAWLRGWLRYQPGGRGIQGSVENSGSSDVRARSVPGTSTANGAGSQASPS